MGAEPPPFCTRELQVDTRAAGYHGATHERKRLKMFQIDSACLCCLIIDYSIALETGENLCVTSGETFLSLPTGAGKATKKFTPTYLIS